MTTSLRRGLYRIFCVSSRIILGTVVYGTELDPARTFVIRSPTRRERVQGSLSLSPASKDASRYQIRFTFRTSRRGFPSFPTLIMKFTSRGFVRSNEVQKKCKYQTDARIVSRDTSKGEKEGKKEKKKERKERKKERKTSMGALCPAK